mgnify:CR=1 FL=1
MIDKDRLIKTFCDIVQVDSPSGEEEAMALIVRGFIEPIAKQLPLEYAVELNRLIEMEMEGSVG